MDKANSKMENYVKMRLESFKNNTVFYKHRGRLEMINVTVKK